MVVDRAVKEFRGVSEEAFLADLSGAVGGGACGTDCSAFAISRTNRLASVRSVCHYPGDDIPVLDSGLFERIRLWLPEWSIVDDMCADTVLLLCLLPLQGPSWEEVVGMALGHSGRNGGISDIACRPGISAGNDRKTVRTDVAAVLVDVPVC